MIEPDPRWTFSSRRSLTQWYGHVHLLPTRVLGQWLCLDRADGRLLWERGFSRPNTVHGTADGVIIAAEMRSDGPWTADFGVYGISLETGALLWTSHGKGLWGGILRLLDLVPGFTNELRDSPDHVVGSECVCSSGRALEVWTGCEVRRVTPEEIRRYEQPRSDAWRLYEGAYSGEFTRVPAGPGLWLSHRRDEHERSAAGFRLHLLRDDGSVCWSFDLAETGFHTGGNYYSYRFCRPYVYLVVSEEPQQRPHPTEPHSVVPNPAMYRLLTLDVIEGRIIQNVRLHEDRLTECRIEDADEHGLLISRNGTQLSYYPRRISPTA